MNRHVMVTLMLCCLAIFLFNIGGSADRRGGSGGLGGDDGDISPSPQAAPLAGQAAVPAPEFPGVSMVIAVLVSLVAYWFIRKKNSLLFNYN